MTKSPCFSWVEASEGTAVGFTVSDTMAVVLILRVCQLEARARASRSVGMAGLLDFPFEQLPGTVGAAGPELILGRPWPFDLGLNCQILLTALFLRLCVQHICASAARPSHLLSIRSAALRSDSGRPFWLRLIIIIKKKNPKHCLRTHQSYLTFKIQPSEQIVWQRIFLLLIFFKEVHFRMFICGD